jgi:hypothetical protein
VKLGYRVAAGAGGGAITNTTIMSDDMEVDRKTMRLVSPRLLSVVPEEDPDRNNTVKKL